jgi:hypothetical protein
MSEEAKDAEKEEASEIPEEEDREATEIITTNFTPFFEDISRPICIHCGKALNGEACYSCHTKRK